MLELVDLPEDMLQLVVSMLDVEHVFNVLLTCRHLKQIADSDYVWSILYQRYFGELSAVSGRTAKEAFRASYAGFQYFFGKWYLLRDKYGLTVLDLTSPFGAQLQLPALSSSSANKQRLLVKTRFVMYSLEDSGYAPTYLFHRPGQLKAWETPPLLQNLYLWGWDVQRSAAPGDVDAMELVFKHSKHAVQISIRDAEPGVIRLHAGDSDIEGVRLVATDDSSPIEELYARLKRRNQST